MADDSTPAPSADAEAVNSVTEYTPGPNAVDITPEQDGGVLKEIKREGGGDAHPVTGDEVYVHYVGTLLNGEKFDSSRDRNKQFEFTIGKGKVIKAWDLGVATMKLGELAVLTCKADYAYGDAGAGEKIPPGATLVFEVELFDWHGEDITADKDNGVQKSKLKSGEGFQTPNEGAQCSIHLRGVHEGRQFEEKDVDFVFGEGVEAGIIEGIEMLVKSMVLGEEARVVIKSQYGYGAKGNSELNIPAGATLQYDVTLKSFEKAKESWEMDPSEKVDQADIFKTKGTNYFKKGTFDLANKNYNKAIELIKDEAGENDNLSPEMLIKKTELLKSLHLNAAMCCLKMSDNLQARDHCDTVLETDAKNEKALFRRATAKLNLQEYEDAIADFKTVLEVAPENKAAKNQVSLATQKIRAAKEKEKKTFAGMFQKFADIDAKREVKKEEVNGTEEKEEDKMENEEEDKMEKEEDKMETEEVKA